MLPQSFHILLRYKMRHTLYVSLLRYFACFQVQRVMRNCYPSIYQHGISQLYRYSHLNIPTICLTWLISLSVERVSQARPLPAFLLLVSKPIKVLKQSQALPYFTTPLPAQLLEARYSRRLGLLEWAIHRSAWWEFVACSLFRYLAVVYPIRLKRRDFNSY